VTPSLCKISGPRCSSSKTRGGRSRALSDPVWRGDAFPFPLARDPSRSDDDLQSMVPRTVADRLAFRLHLRPLNTDPGVFPPAAAPDRSAVGLFPLVALRSPSGTHLRYRTFSLPACAVLVAIGSASHEVACPSGALHPGNRLGRISRAGQALRHTGQQGLPIVRRRKTIHLTSRARDPPLPDSRRVGCRDEGPLLRKERGSKAPLAGSLRRSAAPASHVRFRGSPHRSGRNPFDPAASSSGHPPGGFRLLSPPHQLSDAPGSDFEPMRRG
jgi:hypothetical protein